jgi:hypothetical protein
VPIDLLRATRLAPAPTDVKHFGLDVVGVRACDDPLRAAQVLDGFAVPSPHRTVDVVRDGVRVRVERRSAAREMARTVLDDRITAIDVLPLVGTIKARAPAWRSPRGEVGLLDDNSRLWTVDPAAAEANGSIPVPVTAPQWGAHSRGGDLRHAR